MILDLKRIIFAVCLKAVDELMDPHILISQAAVMADAIIKGEEVQVNDITTYDNRNGLIPSFLCMPKRMSKYNY